MLNNGKNNKFVIHRGKNVLSMHLEKFKQVTHYFGFIHINIRIVYFIYNITEKCLKRKAINYQETDEKNTRFIYIYQ